MFCQNTVSAQHRNAEVVLENGEVLNGLVLFSIGWDYLKFKEERGSKGVKYDAAEVKEVKVLENDTIYRYSTHYVRRSKTLVIVLELFKTRSRSI